MLVGVVAHADGAVRQVAEYAPAVFSGDGGIPAAANLMLRLLRGETCRSETVPWQLVERESG